MKIFFYFIGTIILFGFAPLHGQRFEGKIVDWPDGIFLHYFNSNDTSCNSEIFISDELKVKVLCKDDAYKRVDISGASKEIKRLNEILTFDFIDSLLECCGRKGCPDTIHGYHFICKKGKEYRSIYIDFNFIDESICGNRTLAEIISLYNKIVTSY
jgi:hypothetical protein